LKTQSCRLDGSSLGLSNIFGPICHGLFLFFGLFSAFTCAIAQTPGRILRIRPPEIVAEGWVQVGGEQQMRDGPWYKLRKHASVLTPDFILKADEIDYNDDTGYAEARGNVSLDHFEGGEQLWADVAEYDFSTDTGKFYNVHGTTPLNLEARRGILTSTNPFYFEGDWAEKLKEKYILHDGFITNCKVPKPWWVLRGPKFDVIPNDRAIAYRTVFRLRGFPLFYAPVYYKSLERMPRRSGFLTPNIGNSSRRGKMVGAGYYWAINRSYDATYRAQYFTQRGFAHTIDFRGKPRAGTDISGFFYGVNDRGLLYQTTCPVTQPDGSVVYVDCTARRKEGGLMFSIQGSSDLGHGWHARVDVNYLSSMVFRQAFTETFNEAIYSESHSVGFVAKDWSSYGLNFVFQRLENFQSLKPDDTIVIRKLPEVDFNSRDRRIWQKIPVWVSWDASAGLLRRTQLLFQTRQNLERVDAYPRILTSLHWKGFTMTPSFAVRESRWGESLQSGRIAGVNINRLAREAYVELSMPSFERVYSAPGWLGQKLKHVIEPRASFRYVAGVDDFDEVIQFDETELYSNTQELEYSLTNRLFAKRKNGAVDEVLTWEIAQRRYFDPTFGGAVQACAADLPYCRNVVLSAIELTPFAFLDQPRRYSPIVSTLRVSPLAGFGVEWRSDYDPFQRRGFVNSRIQADARHGVYFFTLGHSVVRGVQQLTPNANQLDASIGYGRENKRGWNAAFRTNYDFRKGYMPYATAQATYNTDCCGLSVEFSRLGFRNDNLFRVAFAVANLGSFGTLRKQEKMF
jgi:LPS-assembly protein